MCKLALTVVERSLTTRLRPTTQKQWPGQASHVAFDHATCHTTLQRVQKQKKTRSLSCLEIVHGGQHGHSEHFWRTEFTVHHNIERLTLVDASKGYKGVSMYTHA
jgi:hypothetical protein